MRSQEVRNRDDTVGRLPKGGNVLSLYMLQEFRPCNSEDTCTKLKLCDLDLGTVGKHESRPLFATF